LDSYASKELLLHSLRLSLSAHRKCRPREGSGQRETVVTN